MPTALTALQFDIARAVPSLWKKAQDPQLTSREQHIKFLDLLIWIAGKQAYTAKQRSPVQYWQDAVKKDGRIDLILRDAADAPALALELDWTKNASSVYKLQAAAAGGYPILWLVGVACPTKEDAKQLRTFANETAGKSTHGWLPIFHLEHGWI